MTATTPRRRRRFASLAVAALAVAVLVSGCTTWFVERGSSGGSDRPVAQSTPAAEDVDADLRPFYDQVLNWTDCGDGLQCAEAKAPLDWQNPSASDISLALIKHPASAPGERLGSLLVNPGGPGGSGYDFVKDSLDFAVSDKLQAQYDVVGFDPRGVGRSSAVTCLTDKEMDSYLYDVLPGARGSQEWLDAYTASSKNFAASCEKNSPELLGHVDTVSAARDLDLLRATLGDSKLNYLGYSYGTFLGSTYADLYPQKVGRLVLDGALDPTSSNFDVSVGQAVGFENAIKAYLADCLTKSSCPFNGSVDDGMAKIGELLAQVDASPIRASDGRELGSSSMLTAIIYPLYNAENWSYLSDMFSDVFAGNADYAMQFADGYNGRGSDGKYADNSTEAFMAINCLDYAYTNDPVVVQKQNADLVAAAPTVGPWWSYGDISCDVWPDKTTRTPHAVTAQGAAPILVVGTTGDPATPYAWAQSLASQLSSGQLITFVGEGHTAYGSSSCVKQIVDEYFLKGTVPTSDPRCTS
ncbi:alpha/beta hydrolase fold [Agreia bicolorata]|uniref:Alpha/beta hydrolase fold n=1 Tax=Agreia bicolorata TaxID=110935 RepID=A0A1T4XVB5_9MICO|nr:alpha/beta hydrolase [Agreia bicolorata]SKA93487.1 alpha/beta hydrolase fold [Agreia bicolorata]